MLPHEGSVRVVVPATPLSDPFDELQEQEEWEERVIQLKVQFVDSFGHLSMGLDGLLKSLKSRGKLRYLTSIVGKSSYPFLCTTDELIDEHLPPKHLWFNKKSKQPVTVKEWVRILEDRKKDRIREYRLHHNRIRLVQGKGFFPYDWFVDLKLLEHKGLPKREMWYSILSEEAPTDKDWEEIQKVWREFEMKTFQDWHDLYLKRDVYGLADALQAYRDESIETYGLDPIHYLTLPSYGWEAMLRVCEKEWNANPFHEEKFRLELLSDPEMYWFFKGMIRGGTGLIGKRIAEAGPLKDNIKKLEKIMLDPEMSQQKKEEARRKLKTWASILYLDANNLYGVGLSGYLPHGGFRWMTTEEMIELETTRKLNLPEGWGYSVEVDLLYPEEIHFRDRDFPMCPEHLTICKEHLSDYISEDKHKEHIGHTKLCMTLCDKEKYKIEKRMLKHVLSHGMKLWQVHRGVIYKEAQWMKPFVDLNTRLRIEGENRGDSFAKDFYKLMNNSTYGKSFEDETKRCNGRFFMTEQRKGFLRYMADPFTKGVNMLGSELVFAMKQREKVPQTKPLYVGAIVVHRAC